MSNNYCSSDDILKFIFSTCYKLSATYGSYNIVPIIIHKFITNLEKLKFFGGKSNILPRPTHQKADKGIHNIIFIFIIYCHIFK